MNDVCACLQDPSYDIFGFAKIATRTASAEAGAAAACPANVQKFFSTLFARAQTDSGLQQINADLNLCQDAYVSSYADVNRTLAAYVQNTWVSGVSMTMHLPATLHSTCVTTTMLALAWCTGLGCHFSASTTIATFLWTHSGRLLYRIV